MSFYRRNCIKIRSGISELGEQIFIYRNDIGIQFLFEIHEMQSSSFVSIFKNTDIVEGIMAIEKPDGTFVTADYLEPLIIKDNKIGFEMNATLANAFDQTGEYLIQFKIFDECGCRLTIPEFAVNVKEGLGGLSSYSTFAVAGESIINETIVRR